MTSIPSRVFVHSTYLRSCRVGISSSYSGPYSTRLSVRARDLTCYLRSSFGLPMPIDTPGFHPRWRLDLSPSIPSQVESSLTVPTSRRVWSGFLISLSHSGPLLLDFLFIRETRCPYWRWSSCLPMLIDTPVFVGDSISLPSKPSRVIVRSTQYAAVESGFPPRTPRVHTRLRFHARDSTCCSRSSLTANGKSSLQGR